ncbi:polyadenylate-binding protein-interacting protein 2 [Lingula anatina]|uniref:Polyadenylate-binding protein-interacting protein 2 n=1 Tax=Lingula anatina TaxID=7574 RepID=A0A1S3IBH2_LINAN|nr:polyadenylate-binding protein-interacting protein 2 [Lingula anatina]|eukprot:XP_013395518.1 polyadenylate-binding protein-interacting protein 2 [Lingula anatina]
MKLPVDAIGPKTNMSTTTATQSRSEVDFSEYVWMGEELEEFDRKCEEEFWEEQFIECCFEEMIAEEENRLLEKNNEQAQEEQQLAENVQALNLDKPELPVITFQSLLNPNAPVFIPRSMSTDR